MKSDKLILVSLSLLMFPLLCFGQAKVGVDKKIELLEPYIRPHKSQTTRKSGIPN